MKESRRKDLVAKVIGGFQAALHRRTTARGTDSPRPLLTARSFFKISGDGREAAIQLTSLELWLMLGKHLRILVPSP
jgi:hypothetical protein